MHTVGLIFGSKSPEHDISWISAQSVVPNVDRDKWDLLLYYIDKEGLWWQLLDKEAFLSAKKPEDYQSDRLALSFIPNSPQAHIMAQDGTTLAQPDVLFPMTHGTFGEDGTLQGFLQMLGFKVAGCDMLGAAITFDKDVTKRLLQEANIPVVPFLCLIQGDSLPEHEQIKKTVGYPCFVKPAKSGSSIGISRVESYEQLPSALKEAFAFDRKVLIEKSIEGREIECSVLADPTPRASKPGELITGHTFYDFDAKYVHTDDLQLMPVADLPPNTQQTIQSLATQAFCVLDCNGMARVDFFLDHEQNIWLNEVNSIPGFTPLSLYPRMWEASGLSYQNLVSTLLEQALATVRHPAD